MRVPARIKGIQLRSGQINLRRLNPGLQNNVDTEVNSNINNSLP